MPGTKPLKKNTGRPSRSALPAHSEVQVAVSVWLRLLKCHNLVFRELKKSVKKDGRITYPQFDVLAQLSRTEEGMSFVQLSRKLTVTSGNLTGIVDRLTREGFVYRDPDQIDRRVVWIRLTDQGRSVITALLPIYMEKIESMFSSLPHKSLSDLRDLLGQCRVVLEDNAD